MERNSKYRCKQNKIIKEEKHIEKCECGFKVRGKEHINGSQHISYMLKINGANK